MADTFLAEDGIGFAAELGGGVILIGALKPDTIRHNGRRFSLF